MQQQDQLFELIRSLSPHEKGYIRRMSALHHQDGENNYTRLFDAIDRQKKYDEAALKKKLAKEKFVRNFPGAKNYLLNAILRHLESYDSSTQREVRSLLSQYAIMRRKGLLALGYKLLRRAHELCRKNELDYQRTEVLMTLLSHTIAYGGHPEWPGGPEDLLKHIRESTSLNYSASSMRYELYQLKKQTPGMIRARTTGQADMYRQKALQLLEYDKSTLKSFDTRYQYYQLLTNYFYISNENESGLRYANELCDWLLENWSYAVPQAMPYIAAFYNKALYELMLYKPGLQKSLDVLERLLVEEQLGNPDSRVLYRRLKLLEAWETCRYEDVHRLVASGISFLREHKGLISHPAEEILYHLLNAFAHFAEGSLDAAAKELRLLLRHPFEEKAHTLSSNARLVLLIVEFERGDRLGLDSQIRSTYRFLLKKKQLHQIEKCVLDFLRFALRKMHGPEEMPEAFRELKKNIETGVRLFDFVSYLESRITGVPFAQVRLQHAGERWGRAL
ncbi:MAG: hypothetical protein FD123_713 [Bacteroidetes bacterium]|nr:MAG: hypothetical protein FD123_713 [Bacteroidota bacterium]